MKNDRFSTDEDDDDEETSWQDSYSDLMTDLLAIFVVLFAFAMMSQAFENAKRSVATEAVVMAAEKDAEILEGQDGVLEAGEQVLQQQRKEQESESMEEFMNTADAYIEEDMKDMTILAQSSNVILIRVAGSVLFDSGEAKVSNDAKDVLEKVAHILSMNEESISMVRIEGHTDDIAIHSRQYSSNWELSTYRAINVVKWLVESTSLDESQFSAVGYGEYHPIDENSTEEGRSNNRRVDFIVELKNN